MDAALRRLEPAARQALMAELTGSPSDASAADANSATDTLASTLMSEGQVYMTTTVRVEKEDTSCLVVWKDSLTCIRTVQQASDDVTTHGYLGSACSNEQSIQTSGEDLFLDLLLQVTLRSLSSTDSSGRRESLEVRIIVRILRRSVMRKELTLCGSFQL